MLIVSVLGLGMLGQPNEAVCSNCSRSCWGSGSYCGYQCVCGCHNYQCLCFAIYERSQAETDGYTFE